MSPRIAAMAAAGVLLLMMMMASGVAAQQQQPSFGCMMGAPCGSVSFCLLDT
jgi:hypothetical protein